MAALLLDHGADLHATAADGSQPLHAAAVRNGGDAVAALLDRGADLQAADDAGVTPFAQATQTNTVH